MMEVAQYQETNEQQNVTDEEEMEVRLLFNYYLYSSLDSTVNMSLSW